MPPPPFGPPPGFAGPGHPPPPPPVSPEQEEQLAAFLKANDPDRLEELQKLKKENQMAYRMQVAEGVQRMQFLEMLKQDDPTGYQSTLQEIKLDARARQLARSYRKAADDKKAALKKELRQVVDQLFGIREGNRKRQVERLEKELADMKERLKQREAHREEIVDKHVGEMLTEPDMRW